VLGGQLAQDVINVLGQTQQPIQNFVIFDGDRMEGVVYALHPEGIPLGAAQLQSQNTGVVMPTDALGAVPMAVDLPGVGVAVVNEGGA